MIHKMVLLQATPVTLLIILRTIQINQLEMILKKVLPKTNLNIIDHLEIIQMHPLRVWYFIEHPSLVEVPLARARTLTRYWLQIQTEPACKGPCTKIAA